MKNIFKKLFKNKFTTAVTIFMLITGGYFGFKFIKKGNEPVRYVLAAVEKGTVVVSVSGSGQVSTTDEIDIKPKVSGEISGFYIEKDEQVKTGELLAKIDPTDVQRAVNDSQINLDNAQAKLDELLAPPGAQDLLQAENSLAQAERDLEKAQKDYENIESDAEKTLSDAYDNGYSDVSSAFFKLSDYINDLKEVMGTKNDPEANIGSYKIIVGDSSIFIQKLMSDYYKAKDFYDKSFCLFGEVFRNDDPVTIYQLISETLETAKAISQALESARHLYDAIAPKAYSQYYISPVIDKMQPKIESDVSSVFSTINSLQQTIDTIDNTVAETPDKIKDAELILKLAEQKLEEKKTALEDLKAGADDLDIKTQQNAVLKAQQDLVSAKKDLANCNIYAPFDGIVSSINIKKGDSVSANTVLATIISQQKIAEISLNEVDVAKVKNGQKATLSFDAISDLTVSGKVIEVDTTGTTNQGVVSYGVKIVFDLVTEQEQIKPGMSVTADIIIEAKPDVLTVPNTAIKFQNGSYYVELAQTSGQSNQELLASVSGITLPNPPKLQPVEVGLANDLSTEIVSGLNEGDIVVSSTISNTASNSQNRTTQSNTFRMPGVGGGGEMRVFNR